MIDQPLTPTKVTLEDLLRLKRAECPPIEFWGEFEKSLHAKQLAAIVEKRPWWRRQSWKQASRWSLPLSAAAALTVSFATLGHPSLAKVKVAPSPLPAVQAPVLAEVSRAPAPLVSVSAEKVVRVVAAVAPIALTLSPAVENKPAPVFASVVEKPVMSASVAHDNSASVTEQIAGIVSSNERDLAAAHFASVSSKEGLALPDLGAFFDKAVARLEPTFASEKEPMVEPLSQVQTPREARRARLVALLSLPGYTEDTGSDSSVMRTREHIASHLNEKALYDSISRLGVKESRVAIQF